MKQNLRVSLGAVVLALATLAAMIFAWLNFIQRTEFETPDDGVVWLDTTQGIQAQRVAPNSPAARAGVRVGDHILAINGSPVARQVQVTKRLWRAGLWTEVRYKLERDSKEFETQLVTAPAEKPTSIENYARVLGLVYLFIGLFIFVRRWNAPRAVHFYIFCLVSFIFFSFHYSGKLDTFDYEVYWIKILAQVLMPALLLHFALVFPERTEGTSRSLSKLGFVYLPPLAILFIHVSTALGVLGWVPWLASRILLDKIAYSYLGVCFLVAGVVFYRNYRGAPAGVLRQQLKWLTAGTFVGTFPFVAFYIVPFAFDAASKPWMKF
jgi:two-component system, NtrC family, sensor kinase